MPAHLVVRELSETPSSNTWQGIRRKQGLGPCECRLYTLRCTQGSCVHMGTSRCPRGFSSAPDPCTSGACATPVPPAHARGRPAEEGAWERLRKVSLSHRDGRLCGLFVPSLPSVSWLFSSWPAGQESFVEGTRKRSGRRVWAHHPCGHTDPRTQPGTDRRPGTRRE